MRYAIIIPLHIERRVKAHLFQSEIEQGAFLFARITESPEELSLAIVDYCLIPPGAWEEQSEHYLELKDSERARIMKLARDGNVAAIECHSHPGSGKRVWFSPSDCIGIAEFALYAKWKLDGKPYGAMVWGESSVDAVIWHGEFVKPMKADEVRIVGQQAKVFVPRGTWWGKETPSYTRKNLW